MGRIQVLQTTREMTDISEIFSAIAQDLELPVWEIPAVGGGELNNLLEKTPLPCMAWFFNQSQELTSDMQSSRIYSRFNTRVYFLGKPADDTADSLLQTRKALAVFAVQFRQLMQAREEFTGVPNNDTLPVTIDYIYPSFDARLVQLRVNFDIRLDLNLPVCKPQ